METPAASARPLLWRGLIVALLGPIVFFAQVQLGTLTTPWYAPILGTLGAAIVFWAFARSRGIGALILGILLACLAAFEWFVVGTSTLPAYAGPVEVGKPFPAFKSTLAEGSTLTNADLAGKPTALIFYRGRWCFLCMKELRMLEKQHADFEKRGVRVLVASLDSSDDAAKSQADFPHLTVVADTNRTLIDAVGTLHKGANPNGDDAAAPTTILVDKTGVVRWLFRPDRFFTRLTPNELLAEIDRNLK